MTATDQPPEKYRRETFENRSS